MDTVFLKLKNYFVGVREEMRQVSWLTRQELITSSIVVIIITFVVAFYLGSLDFIFNNILGRFLLK